MTKIKNRSLRGTFTSWALPLRTEIRVDVTSYPFCRINLANASGSLTSPRSGILRFRTPTSAQSPCLDIRNHRSAARAGDGDIRPRQTNPASVAEILSMSWYGAPRSNNQAQRRTRRVARWPSVAAPCQETWRTVKTSKATIPRLARRDDSRRTSAFR